ncbi:UNKNOWN [Stylonychia lemnae]|uniref:Uncharacterized protein n=1 Tax=Stylonychia lemnae TaxID=5949 RepID=A0A078AU78_STYLE|nr:UNKNOWN [Stylonychia lemnae]|eukprot:CDW84388.1 UNKNOWN [Stylonychia lemnae]
MRSQVIIGFAGSRNYNMDIKSATMQIVRGPKNQQISQQIEKLVTPTDVRELYYNLVNQFQDHHYANLLQRIQQILTLSKLTSSKKQSLFLMQTKIQDKLIHRVQYFDYEDMILLIRVLGKMFEHRSNALFCHQIFEPITKRITSQDFVQLMRSQQDYEKFLSLQIYINLVFNAQLVVNQLADKTIENCFYELGAVFSEELKRGYLNLLTDNPQNLLRGIEALSRFKFHQSSIIRELINKLKGNLQHYNHVQLIHLLNSLSNFLVEIDPKFVRTIVHSIIKDIDKTTNQQIAQFLDALLNIQYDRDIQLGEAVIREMERRQVLFIESAKTNSEEENKNAKKANYKSQDADKPEKLQTQEAVRILRGIFQLGYSDQFNQSFILWRMYSNMFYKQIDSISNNQLQETHQVIRIILTQHQESPIRSRIELIHNATRDQIIKRVQKFNSHKLLFIILLDLIGHDSQKIFIENTEFIQNAFKQFVINIEDFRYAQDLHLINHTFQIIDQNQKQTILSHQINKSFKLLKDQFLNKKDYEPTYHRLNKQIYLYLLNSINSQLPVQSIQQDQYWIDLQNGIQSLQKIGLYKKLQDQLGSDIFLANQYKFQKLVLEDKFKILPEEYNYNKLLLPHLKKQGKIEKIEHIFKDKNIEYELNKVIELDGVEYSFDFYLPSRNFVLKIQDIYTKHNPDPRFRDPYSIIDLNNTAIRGDQEFNKKDKIVDYLNEHSNVNLIDQYTLKYHQGLSLKYIDHKKAKHQPESFIENLIK